MTWGAGYLAQSGGGSSGGFGSGYLGSSGGGGQTLHFTASSGGGGGGGGNSSLWPDIVSDAAGNTLRSAEGFATGFPKLVGGLVHDVGHDQIVTPLTSLLHGHPLAAAIKAAEAPIAIGSAGVIGFHDDKGKQTFWTSRDLRQIGAGTVDSYATKYNPAGPGGVTGLAHRMFVDDPLGTFLDIFAVTRVAGVGAKLAAEGRLGSTLRAPKLDVPLQKLTPQRWQDITEYQPAMKYNPAGGISDTRLRELTDSPHGPLTGDVAGMVDEGGLVRTYNPATTIQGLYRQRWFDAFSQQHENLLRFGSQARISRVLSKERRAAVSQSMTLVRTENLLRSKLKPEEVSAVDVVLEGSRLSKNPIQDTINFFKGQHKEGISEESRRGLEMQIDRLNSIPDDVITHPRPEFTRYIEHLRKMDEAVSKAAIAGGRLAAMSREARRFLPQRIQSGARVESNADALKALRNQARKDHTKGVNRRHDLEVQLGRHKENITNTTAFIKRIEEELRTGATSSTVAKRELRLAKRRLSTAEINRDRVQRWLDDQKATNKTLKKTKSRLKKQAPEKDWQGGTPLEDLQTQESNALESLAAGGEDHGPLAQFGPTFRQAHVVPPPKGAAGLFRDRVIDMITRNPRVPGVFKMNEGKIYQAGLLAMNPERFSVDFMVQMQYSHALDVFRHQVLPLARDIDPTQPFNSQFDSIVWTDPAKKGASLEGGAGRSVPRSVSYLDKATQDVGTNIAQAEKDHGEWAAQFLDKGIPAEYLRKYGDESVALKKMRDDGAMIVPSAARKVFEKEISQTRQGVRLFWDRGLMGAWRYLTLNVVPRWAVNNAVTSITLYALNYAGRDGMRSFLDAVKREKGAKLEGRMRFRYLREMAGGTLDRPAGRFVDEHGMSLLHQSSFSANERNVPHPGIFAKEQEVAYGKLNATLRKGGKGVAMSGNKAHRAAAAWGKWITNLNSEAENLVRDASALTETRRLARKMGMANKTLEDLAAAMKKGTEIDEHLPLKLAQQTIDVMGDFGGLSKTEQNLRRWAVPFYSWYKTITIVTAKLIARKPLMIATLNALSDAALKNPYWNFGFPVPPYLASYIPFSDPSGRSGDVSTLSPVGSNPFQTPLDLTQQAAGLAGLTDASGTSSPASYLNPFGQAGITALTGQDTFFGGEYSGPGSSHNGIVAGLGSLIDVPEQRLLSQVHPRGFAPGGKYQSRTFDTEGKSAVPGLNQGQLDGILQFLGIPVRHVSPSGAQQRAGLAGTSSGGSSSSIYSGGGFSSGSGWGSGYLGGG